MRFNISLEEHELAAVLNALAEQSCKYRLAYDEKPMSISMLHCCDYNDHIPVIINQVEEKLIKDEDISEYIQCLKEESE